MNPEPPSAGDSQGRARLNNSDGLQVINNLALQWKPRLPLNEIAGQYRQHRINRGYYDT